MFDQIFIISQFVFDAFVHIWPYLLITIPLAVAVQMSGASKYISQALNTKPIIAILLATAVGAFSPFCSCGVIPVVAALLIGGVPLAPVMAFWIASPSMDPEIFFLSVATLGWELAVWRLTATLTLSLMAGFTTHLVIRQGWLGQQLLRQQQVTSTQGNWALLKSGWQQLKSGVRRGPALSFTPKAMTLAAETVCCENDPAPIPLTVALASAQNQAVAPVIVRGDPLSPASAGCGDACASGGEELEEGESCDLKPASFQKRLATETWAATLLVIKFMVLAFFLEALITLYLPSEWIVGLLGPQNPWATLSAALIGVPLYTSNLTALPLIGGLLSQGMHPAAALAFLIAGPTTTLPAMAAVWGLVSRRVFLLYVSFSLVGAVGLGYLYSLILNI